MRSIMMGFLVASLASGQGGFRLGVLRLRETSVQATSKEYEKHEREIIRRLRDQLQWKVRVFPLNFQLSPIHAAPSSVLASAESGACSVEFEVTPPQAKVWIGGAGFETKRLALKSGKSFSVIIGADGYRSEERQLDCAAAGQWFEKVDLVPGDEAVAAPVLAGTVPSFQKHQLNALLFIGDQTHRLWVYTPGAGVAAVLPASQETLVGDVFDQARRHQVKLLSPEPVSHRPLFVSNRANSEVWQSRGVWVAAGVLAAGLVGTLLMRHGMGQRQTATHFRVKIE